MAERAVRSIRIQVAHGGWTVDVEREPEKNKKGESVCCWEPTTPSVYTDKSVMLKSVGDLLPTSAPKLKIGKRTVGGDDDD